MVSTRERIYRLKAELDKHGKIPASYHTVLESRLVVTFKPIGRLPRGVTPRPMQDSRLLSIRRKARAVYLDVLHEDPNIFLPFILQVSEKTCSSFNIREFFEQHEKETPTRFNFETRQLLQAIASRHGILQDVDYRKLMDFFFKQTRPVTHADGNQFWEYSAANRDTASQFFGNRILDMMDVSSKRMQEKGIPTTECIRMRFPKKNFQDVNLILDIGLDYQLVSDFFPRTCEKVFSLLHVHRSESHGDPPGLRMEMSIDNAYFTLRGASIEAISSNFCTSICEAVEKSQLRMWEKNNLLLDTTDCVTMEVSRSPPHHGCIRLRLSFVESFEIMNNLFASNP